MEKKFRFKTTLKCSGCVSKVTPFLNSLRDVTEWSVDLQHPEGAEVVAPLDFAR